MRRRYGPGAKLGQLGYCLRLGRGRREGRVQDSRHPLPQAAQWPRTICARCFPDTSEHRAAAAPPLNRSGNRPQANFSPESNGDNPTLPPWSRRNGRSEVPPATKVAPIGGWGRQGCCSDRFRRCSLAAKWISLGYTEHSGSLIIGDLLLFGYQVYSKE